MLKHPLQASVVGSHRLCTLGAGQRRTGVAVVLATCLHKRAQILTEFRKRRPPNEPPTIINRVDRQVWSQGKRVGKCHEPIFEIWGRHFHDIESPDRLTLVVTEKREGG